MGKKVLGFILACFLTPLLLNWATNNPWPNKAVLTTMSALPVNEAIFFLETNKTRQTMSENMICAVESAAKINPKTPVYALFPDSSLSVTFPRDLLLLPNVYVKKLNYGELLKHKLINKDILLKLNQAQSQYYLSHLSDFLRQLLLYQVGGIYMDNDIITLRKIPKSLEDSNYLFFAAPGKVGSAIMKFQQGHSFLRQSILQAAQNYTGKFWGEIGPTLFTSLAQSNCPQFLNKDNPLSSEQIKAILDCPGYKILPQYLGLPLRTKQRRYLYDWSKESMLKTLLKKTTAIHLFNSAFIKGKLLPELQLTDRYSPIMTIRRKSCPIAYLSMLETFS